jgi:hypothetical protein
MGRGDQDKRVRRAGEQVDQALARRDLEAAVDAVLGLDKGAREPLLALVAPAFRQALPDFQKTSAWARLHTLAARFEQEPRLLLLGADTTTAAAALWPLLVASMRARDHARAARLWKSLVAPVSVRAPALSRAIAAWVAGQGHIGPEAIADLNLDGLPALAAPDPRLGMESPGHSRVAPPPAPTSADGVEGALCTLFATQPLTVVGETLRLWLELAPVDLAKVVRTRAGSLALRELLIHASAKQSLSLPAALLARTSEGVEDDLASELLLATRLLVTVISGHASQRGEAEALAVLAGALVRTTQMGDVAATLVGDFGGSRELVPTALAICQGALARATSLPDERFFSLWGAALSLGASISEATSITEGTRAARAAASGPTWLQSASREVCQRRATLVTYLDKQSGPILAKLLDDLLWAQPSEIVADLIDALWNDASEELRRRLSDLIPDLIENAEEAGMHALEGSHSLRDLATYDRIVGLAEKADLNLPFLAVGGLTLWRRFGLRSLPYCVGLLPYALSQAKPDQRLEVVKAYVGNRVDIDAWLEAIRELSDREPESVASLVEEAVRTMLDRFRSDRSALAHALEHAERFDAPTGLLKLLGHAYQRATLAQENDGAGAEPGPEDRRAREILAFLLRSKMKTTKKPPAARTKRPATRRSKAPRPDGPDGQLLLPLGEEKP